MDDRVKTEPEAECLTVILQSLLPFDEETRRRILECVRVFFSYDVPKDAP